MQTTPLKSESIIPIWTVNPKLRANSDLPKNLLCCFLGICICKYVLVNSHNLALTILVSQKNDYFPAELFVNLNGCNS